MKFKYRGQLNDGKTVDIFDFEGEYAKCDGIKENIHIDDFNSIFVPKDSFKQLALKSKKKRKAEE